MEIVLRNFRSKLDDYCDKILKDLSICGYSELNVEIDDKKVKYSCSSFKSTHRIILGLGNHGRYNVKLEKRENWHREWIRNNMLYYMVKMVKKQSLAELDINYDKLWYFFKNLNILPRLYRNYSFESTYEDMYTYVSFSANTRYFQLTEEGLAHVENYKRLIGGDRSVLVPDIVIGLSLLANQKRVEKIIVDSYEIASELGLEKTYFGDQDILDVFSDEVLASSDYIIEYNDDYFEVLKQRYTKKELAELYIVYLNKNSTRSANISYDTFNYSGIYRALQQLDEYVRVIEKKEKYVIPSDGYGVLSSYCLRNDIQYVSWEPNEVGKIARKLGIIHGKEPVYIQKDENGKRKFMKDYIYIYCYCGQYYKFPAFPGHRYIVIDVPHFKYPSLHRVNNVAFSHKVMFERFKRLIFDPQNYFKMKDVFPLDTVIEQMCINRGIDLVYDYSKCLMIVTISRYRVYEVSQLLPEWALYKVLYLPSYSYPFRVKHKSLIGKDCSEYLIRNYGSGEVYDEGFFQLKSDEIAIADDYILQDKLFIITGKYDTPIRYIRLRHEHRDLFDGRLMLMVYLVNTLSNRGIQYTMYSDASNSRPSTIIQ